MTTGTIPITVRGDVDPRAAMLGRRREIDVAWAAGLFDGEGCITFGAHRVKRYQYCRPRLQLRTTDRDVLDRFYGVMAVGSIVPIRNPRHVALGRKPAWDWRAGAAQDVEEVLTLLLPHLGERRAGVARAALLAVGLDPMDVLDIERSTPMAGPDIADPYRD